jgi:hypothetical protein
MEGSGRGLFRGSTLWHLRGATEEDKENRDQGSQSMCRDMNQASPDSKSEALPLRGTKEGDTEKK